MEIMQLIPYFLVLGLSIGCNILQAVRLDQLMKRITAPPMDHFAEAAVDMLKSGKVEGGKVALEGAVAVMNATKPNVADDFRIETDESITR